MSEYDGRLAIQQRVLPNYRVPFFDTLARRCRGGLALFSGEPLAREAIPVGDLPKSAENSLGANKHIFYPGHFLYFCDQPGLIGWLKHAKPDSLILEANPRYLKNFQAISWMRKRGKPVLGWGLGVPEAAGLFSRIRAKMLGKFDGLIAYSRRGAAEYARTGLLRPGTIFVAHNAVSPRPTQTPAAPGSGKGSLNLLFVGRLQKRKRLDLLLQACAELPLPVRPVITIVGDGPDRSVFEKQARSSALDVTFTGALGGERLAERYRGTDLFVLPGTGGLAVQEAMSYGLPVVVAEGDGTQSDLVRPDNGWLVPPGDANALRNALQLALSDRTGLARKGAESRRITEEEINIETMADRFIEALRVTTVGR
jgi:glycosyltransferase involved in cell wall biosynthesis